ncbi:MAG: S9 family peptidase [Candidatus Eiseniibacteriota bacterium]|nr:MAG: S9 family peptidase [Candidatus Eisenbacteria bacterium]
MVCSTIRSSRMPVAPLTLSSCRSPKPGVSLNAQPSRLTLSTLLLALFVALVLSLPPLVTGAAGASETDSDSVSVEGAAAAGTGANSPSADGALDAPLLQWLVLGPCQVRLPVFSDSTRTGERAQEVLGRRYLDLSKLAPVEGEKLSWGPGVSLAWEKGELADDVIPFGLAGHDTSTVGVAYVACYLDSPRWQKMELVLKTRQRTAVYLDGEEVSKKTEATRETEEPEEFKTELKLPRDKHVLLVKSVFDSRDSLAEWFVRPYLRMQSEALPYVPAVSLDPVHRFSFKDMEKMKSVRDVAASPDGKLVAVVVREVDTQRDKYVTLLDVFDARSGERVHSIRMGDRISEPEWAPDSKSMVFLSDSPGEGADLWLLDTATRGLEKIVAGEKGPAAPRWSPDGAHLFFTSWDPQPAEKDERSYEKLEELYERWGYWKNKSHLFVLTLQSRTRLQLTTGEFTVQFYELSPDGRTVAFLRSVPITERPFFETELWALDVESLKSRTLLTERFDISRLSWSPDGTRIAFIGECSVGTKDDVHNRYHSSLYLLDVSSGAYEKLSRDSGPSLGAELLGVRWGRDVLWWDGNRRLYFVATDKTRVRLYHLDPAAPERVREAELPFKVPYYFDVSADRKHLACVGTSVSDHRKVYVVDLSKSKTVEVFDPARDAMKHALRARVQPVDFVNSDGVTINGWLYYPHDFDAGQSYPLIVYYYGGVTAAGETFSREAHWFAGQGYFYYVLTPRGAAGYGQEFADAHVNDWGGLSAKDVMEGVENVLSGKSFLDRERIGCYGGSYGGFLTMSLLTQTDLFRAAVALYGISNIASYWGVGWWGYLYSDVASALSFPWNRPDVYVKKSPLFAADKIETPLLLLHGTADTNVPPAESDQMFAALKVLDRDVVYVKWEGEGHGISSKPSSSRDSRQIMLEWFDKQLKGQPEAWDERWRQE